MPLLGVFSHNRRRRQGWVAEVGNRPDPFVAKRADMLDEVKSAIEARPAGTRLVFLSDYDGTLAGFHKDPDDSAADQGDAGTAPPPGRARRSRRSASSAAAHRRPPDAHAASQPRLPRRPARHGDRSRRAPLAASRSRRGARGRARAERAARGRPPARARPDSRRQACLGRRPRSRGRGVGCARTRFGTPTSAPRRGSRAAISGG